MIRTKMSGEDAGKAFYVCLRWPECNHIIKYAEENEIKIKYKISIEELKKLEWKRFEELCSEFLRAYGFNPKETTLGPDGGIDIIVYKENNKEPFGVVQCKAWHIKDVGERYIRDLLGVMTKGKYKCGMFMTTSEYTKAAIDFAKDTKITLVTGKMIVDKLNKLPDEKLNLIMQKVFEGDYTTPTCPKCGIKMIKRKSENGIFWGCPKYPRCKSKLKYKQESN